MREAQLVQNIIQYLDRYRLRNATEIHMGVGVPDIVLNMGAPKNMTIISDYYLLSIAEYIKEHSGAELSDISDYFSFEKGRAQYYINHLLKQNIIVRNKDKYYSKRKLCGAYLGTTISIEAKMKDWKTGVLQAERYLLFSDYSYLALPEDKAKNIDEFHLKEVGIGLLSISGTSISELISPKKSSICDYKQKYIVTSAVISASGNIVKRRAEKVFSKLK